MTDSRTTAASGGRPRVGPFCWVWPFRHDRRTADALWRMSGAGLGLCSGARWVMTAVAIAVLPMAAGYYGGFNSQQLLTALGLFVPFVALVREDRVATATAMIGLVLGLHSLLAILMAALDPAAASAMMPGAAEYWQKQEAWLRTGQDPEYETTNWLPAHLHLLGGISVFSYTSLGLIPLFQGMREVDLMNFYVGRLSTISKTPGAAVFLGWHLWSVLRGISYTFLVFELSSISLGQMSGRGLSTFRRRAWRWGIGLGFFLGDCLVKYCTLASVRDLLFQNIRS